MNVRFGQFKTLDLAPLKLADIHVQRVQAQRQRKLDEMAYLRANQRAYLAEK